MILHPDVRFLPKASLNIFCNKFLRIDTWRILGALKGISDIQFSAVFVIFPLKAKEVFKALIAW